MNYQITKIAGIIQRFPNTLHPEKARAPMLSSFTGNTIFASFEQDENALSPIDTTECGRRTAERLSQPLKALSPIVVRLSGHVTLDSFEQYEKVESLIVDNPRGSITEFNSLHQLNAPSPIVVVAAAKCISCKLSQDEKQLFPKVVRLSGKVFRISFLHPEKA